MPDANIVVGLLGVATSCLGSLNNTDPKNDFEALKLIDENDPIRCALKQFDGIEDIPNHVVLTLTDGNNYTLHRILEFGYGAFRAYVSWVEPYIKSRDAQLLPMTRYTPQSGTPETDIYESTEGVIVLRYSCIASIRQMGQYSMQTY